MCLSASLLLIEPLCLLRPWMRLIGGLHSIPSPAERVYLTILLLPIALSSPSEKPQGRSVLLSGFEARIPEDRLLGGWGRFGLSVSLLGLHPIFSQAPLSQPTLQTNPAAVYMSPNSREAALLARQVGWRHVGVLVTHCSAGTLWELTLPRRVLLVITHIIAWSSPPSVPILGEAIFRACSASSAGPSIHDHLTRRASSS